MTGALGRLDRAVAGQERLWRVTLTDFAAWWDWRSRRSWTATREDSGAIVVRFAGWDAKYPMALEIDRGAHVASVPVGGPRIVVQPERLVYARRALRVDGPETYTVAAGGGPRAWLRSWLGWERATPAAELPNRLLRDRLKKTLRRWRDASGPGGEREP
jgi:hypothetical protein